MSTILGYNLIVPNDAVQVRVVIEPINNDVTISPVSPIPFYYYVDTELEITVPAHAPRLITIVFEATFPDDSITNSIFFIDQL